MRLRPVRAGPPAGAGGERVSRFRRMPESVAAAKKRTFVEAICEGAEDRGEAARLASTHMTWVNEQLDLDPDFAAAVAVAEEDGRDTYCDGPAPYRGNSI